MMSLNVIRSGGRTRGGMEDAKTASPESLQDDAVLKIVVLRLVQRSLSMHPGYVLPPGGIVSDHAEREPSKRAS